MDGFQNGVKGWMVLCFPPQVFEDKIERCDRFLEEAIELTQACGHGRDRAHALVDYVFDRAVGDPEQEVGGTMVTLAALCSSFDIDLGLAALRELDRIMQPETMAKIRAKQAAKPTGSALPIATAVRPLYSPWTCLMTEDGDPYAAFVHGHLEAEEIDIPEAVRFVVEGFKRFGFSQAAILEQVLPFMDLDHFYLRPSPSVTDDPKDQAYTICEGGVAGAFAVTGARF